MKKIFTFVLCLFYIVSTNAQDNNRYSAFQLSLVHPLSTNGAMAAEYTNGASVNILMGLSKNENSLAIAGLGNIILHDAAGLQLAGAVNYIGNEGKGVAIGGLVNLTRDSYNGLQLGGLVNATGKTKGMQFSGMLNTATDVKGIQFSGLVGVAKKVKGLQFSGMLNTATDVKGVQFSGLVGVAKKVKGLQFSGMLNTATDVKGVQFSGMVGVAKKVKGLQFSGMLNTATDVKGVQFAGLVNVARKVNGMQFAGLINVATDSDYPIGIINIIRHGRNGIGITYDMTGNMMLAFRTGSRYTYGIIGFGYNPIHNVTAAECGYGAHIPVCKWFEINNEIKATSIYGTNDISAFNIFNIGYLLAPSFTVADHYNLFAGVSLNFMSSGDSAASSFFPKHSLWKRYSPCRGQRQLYIGYQVGLQYIF